MKKRCISFIRNFSIAVFCTFTAFSHCLFGYASNDDEYFTFSDIDFLTTYSYWTKYGLSADSNYQYTDTYVSNGSVSYSANITLSGSNSFAASETGQSSFGGGIYFHPTDTEILDLHIVPNSIDGDITPTSTVNGLYLACTFSGYTNGAYERMYCSQDAFNDISAYEFTVNVSSDSVWLESTGNSNLARFVSVEDAVNDPDASTLWLDSSSHLSGSLTLNQSGSLSGTGTINITTTTTNTNSIQYVLPFMKVSSNDLIHPDKDSDARYAFTIDNNNHFVIAFMRNTALNVSGNINTIVRSTGDTYPVTHFFNNTSSIKGGMRLYILEVKDNLDSSEYGLSCINDYKSNTFPSTGIIPIYTGYKNNMSDALYRFLYGSDRLIELLEEGNTNSQNKGQQLDQKTNQMQTQMTQFQNIEDTAGDNMNAALQNINTNPSLISNNKFLMSVDWIRQQYNRLVTNTPFEAVITFCLVFGLGLLLLGKVR